MRTLFDQLYEAYAIFYSPSEHLALDEVIVLFQRDSYFQTVYSKGI
jgi:hypothetical protein